MIEFKLGQIVRLKSSSIRMQVESIKDDNLTCIWSDNEKKLIFSREFNKNLVIPCGLNINQNTIRELNKAFNK
ncbi:hypothetical protein F951_01182 [Acinetobacter soli CIP 110264]|nr:hypothetical protein F951_01182 [Acinetobacter soli CIP 110264]